MKQNNMKVHNMSIMLLHTLLLLLIKTEETF